MISTAERQSQQHCIPEWRPSTADPQGKLGRMDGQGTILHMLGAISLLIFFIVIQIQFHVALI